MFATPVPIVLRRCQCGMRKWDAKVTIATCSIGCLNIGFQGEQFRLGLIMPGLATARLADVLTMHLLHASREGRTLPLKWDELSTRHDGCPYFMSRPNKLCAVNCTHFRLHRMFFLGRLRCVDWPQAILGSVRCEDSPPNHLRVDCARCSL